MVDAGPGESAVSTVAVFAGAGALLAALVLTALLRARARQRGYRRPGELPVAVPGHLTDVERVLRSAGGAAAADAQWLDEALHGLGQLAAATDDGALPDVLAVAVTADELRLVLAAPAPEAIGAWQIRDEGRQWVLSRHADTGYDAATRTQFMPPYPTLVTVGSSDDGEHWLLDLERIGSLTFTGDPQRSADLARFVAAELAHNSWSELLQVTLVGIGAEMAQMYPERLTYADDPEQTLTAAAAQLRGVQRTDTAVLAGRTGPVGGRGVRRARSAHRPGRCGRPGAGGRADGGGVRSPRPVHRGPGRHLPCRGHPGRAPGLGGPRRPGRDSDDSAAGLDGCGPSSSRRRRPGNWRSCWPWRPVLAVGFARQRRSHRTWSRAAATA